MAISLMPWRPRCQFALRQAYNGDQLQVRLPSRSLSMTRRLVFLFLWSFLCVFASSRLCISLSIADDKKDSSAAGTDWSSSVKFPASEKPVRLFNGKDFEGWEGNTGEGGTQKYFTVKDGVI